MQAELAPDLVQPLIGYRLWRIGDDGLWSAYVDERWRRGVHTGVCLAGAAHRDAVPGHDCTCGIYAWYGRCRTLSWAATSHLVAGAVSLWGDVELHPFGMRARHAMIVSLVLPRRRGTKQRWIKDVAVDLDVEAVPARCLEAEALRHGSPVPAGMAPGAAATRVGYAVTQHLGASAGSGWRASSMIAQPRSRD